MGNFIYKRWLLFSVAWLSSFLLLLILMNNTNHTFFTLITIIFIAISIYLVYVFVRHQKMELNKYLQTLNYRIKNAGDNALKSLPIGIILYDRQGVISWYNSFIQQMISNKKGIGQQIDELFPDLKQILDNKSTGEYSFKEKVYNVEHDETERLFYFQDVTELQALKQCIYEDRLVIGFVHLDNLDEVEHVLSDQEENHVITNVYNSILKWGAAYNFSIKKLDADKLLLIMLNKTLQQLIQAKFDILDTVREVNKKSKIPITLSIGLSSEGTESVTLAQNAQNALEIAMARGGDQVAVRKQNKVLFFGGKTNALEKRTRVKARMISSAISNLLQESEWVIIMGHANTDMDSLGAAIGTSWFQSPYRLSFYIGQSVPAHEELWALLYLGEEET